MIAAEHPITILFKIRSFFNNALANRPIPKTNSGSFKLLDDQKSKLGNKS